MDELLRALKFFLTRDLIYIAAGSTTLLALLYAMELPVLAPQPTAIYVLGAALAYTIAYALQDLSSIAHLVCSTMATDLPRLGAWFYKQFTRLDWKSLKDEHHRLERVKAELPDGPTRYHLERTITLQHLSTSFGPCLLAASLLLVVRWRARGDELDLALAASSFLLALALWPLGWIKAAQQAAFLAMVSPVPPTDAAGTKAGSDNAA